MNDLLDAAFVKHSLAAIGFFVLIGIWSLIELLWWVKTRKR